MKSAFNDIIYEKRGIYGVLHVIILLLSLFLIVVISVDTFKNIPFMTQGSYLKIQFWICMFFIADFACQRDKTQEIGDFRGEFNSVITDNIKIRNRYD